MVNLFLVGAAKCGTTSFHDYLNQHPSVHMSSIKEPNYFSYQEIINDDLYYMGAPMIDNSTEYAKLFDNKKEYKIYGESSVSYLFYPSVAKKLFEYNKDSKILIFLRNPVDRAFSHYLMDYSAGYFNNSFEEILDFPERNSKAFQQSIKLSYYYDQLKLYFNTYRPSQIKVIILEEIQKDLAGAMREIEIFLEIEHYKKYEFNIKNSFSATNNQIINLFYRSPTLKQIIKSIFKKRVLDKIKNRFLNSDKPTLSYHIKSRLKNIFLFDVKKISTLLGKDLIAIWGFEESDTNKDFVNKNNLTAERDNNI